jgi:hypothetical protein
MSACRRCPPGAHGARSALVVAAPRNGAAPARAAAPAASGRPAAASAGRPSPTPAAAAAGMMGRAAACKPRRKTDLAFLDDDNEAQRWGRCGRRRVRHQLLGAAAARWGAGPRPPRPRLLRAAAAPRGIGRRRAGAALHGHPRRRQGWQVSRRPTQLASSRHSSEGQLAMGTLRGRRPSHGGVCRVGTAHPGPPAKSARPHSRLPKPAPSHARPNPRLLTVAVTNLSPGPYATPLVATGTVTVTVTVTAAAGRAVTYQLEAGPPGPAGARADNPG